ncbi:MAG: hypothetical protein M3P30_07355 [Chloroflexota bacterium]|nr:hypothetical protein [Chloroflexota bacterium]
MEHDYESADPERGAISKFDLYSGKPRSLPAARANLEAAEACLDLLTRLPKLPSGAEIEDQVIEPLFQMIDDADSEALDAPRPGFPQGIRDGGPEGWNALLLRTALSQLAEADSHTLAELLTWTTETAKAKVIQREEELAFVKDELNRMRRERHPPDRSAMHNITRYESSLNRKFYQGPPRVGSVAGQAERLGHPSRPLGDTIRRPVNLASPEIKKVRNNYPCRE